MERRALGKTGLEVSPLALGGNVFGWTVNEAKGFEILDAWLDEGFNFIDTADSYSTWVPGNKGGESETIIGSWMRTAITAIKSSLQRRLGRKWVRTKRVYQDNTFCRQ